MNRKPKTVLFSGLFLSALFLSACGSGTDANQSTGSGETALQGSKDGLNITVGEDYIDYVKAVAEKFEAEHSIKVNVTEKDMMETLESLPLDGPADLGPDIMLSPYDRIGGLGQQGHLAEVTLPSDDRYDDTDKQQVSVKENVYGAPFVIESLVLYYNKDLLDTPPETFEDLEKLAADEAYAFESEAGKSTGFLANWVDFYHSYGLVSGYGGYVFGKDGEDTSDIGLNTPEAIEGIAYATEWFQDRWPEGMLDAKSAGDFIDDQFIAGKAAAIINGPWGASNYANGDVNYGVATVPVLPNGSEYQPFAGGKGWIISNYAKNFEEAQKWLDFVTNEENSTLLFEEYTKEIPANQQAREKISAAGDDELAVAVTAQYENAVPMPNIPEMAEVWTGAETMMFDAGSGNKTPKQSADDGVKIMKENIEQKYK